METEIKCNCKTPHVVKAGTKTDKKGVRQVHQCTGKTGCGSIIMGQYIVTFGAADNPKVKPPPKVKEAQPPIVKKEKPEIVIRPFTKAAQLKSKPKSSAN